jgi:hypothetical protein
MAHTTREHDPEGALHANNHENQDGDQLNAVHLNSYFKPLKPAHSHATHARATAKATSRTRLLQRPILAVAALVAVFCAIGLLTALVACLRQQDPSSGRRDLTPQPRY